jgi:hypothetical protein
VTTSLLDTIKRVGSAFLDKIFVPVGVVDDTPPTYEDGDARPFRVHKTNHGIYVHIANPSGAAPDAPSIVQGSDGVNAERLATEATLAAAAARLAVPTSAPTQKTPKTVPASPNAAEPIVAAPTPCSTVLVQVEAVDADDPLANHWVCVSGATVTIDNGCQFWPGDSRSIPIDDAQKLYCVGSTSGLILRIEVQ